MKHDIISQRNDTLLRVVLGFVCILVSIGMSYLLSSFVAGTFDFHYWNQRPCIILMVMFFVFWIATDEMVKPKFED